MTHEINGHELEQIRSVMFRLGEFIAIFEAAEEKITQRELLLDKRLHDSEVYVQSELKAIHQTLHDFRVIMTEAGAARFRVNAENTLKEGEKHLAHIKMTSDDFLQRLDESCDRLDRAIAYTVKSVSHAVQSFQPDDLRDMAAVTAQQVRRTADSAIQNLSASIRWLQWRNLVLIFSVAILVTLAMGLYISDEWPWEIHRDVIEQRTLAQAVVKTWGSLSEVDQQHILQNATKNLA